jgi:hypothetical protein
METKKLSSKQIELLKKPLPKEAVSKHPTKTYLSSIKAIYVVERLNEVFGIGTWHLDSNYLTTQGKMVVVQSTFSVPDYGIRLQSYGGNDNTDLGDAYKGATTDALTKIASMLEIGMNVFKGLADAPPLPALTKGSDKWNSVYEYMLNGGDIIEVEKKFYISAELKNELLKNN